MTTKSTKLTSAQFYAIMEYYDAPDQPQPLHWFNYTLTERLERLGYITRQSGGNYLLADASKEYLARFKQQVEARHIKGMSVTQREWVVRHRLEPRDENDRKLMVDMAQNDRSERVVDAIIGSELFRDALTQNEWNRLAHSQNVKLRMAAATHADIEEFADETDIAVVARAEGHCESEGRTVPRELLEKWYRNGNTGAISAMNEHDLDVALDDGNTAFIRSFVQSHMDMFTTERILRVHDLAKAATGKDAEELNNAMKDLLWKSDHLPEFLIKEYADEWHVEWRLIEYRKAYRKLKKAENVFADLDCEMAREQRRLALEEND